MGHVQVELTDGRLYLTDPSNDSAAFDVTEFESDGNGGSDEVEVDPGAELLAYHIACVRLFSLMCSGRNR